MGWGYSGSSVRILRPGTGISPTSRGRTWQTNKGRSNEIQATAGGGGGAGGPPRRKGGPPSPGFAPPPPPALGFDRAGGGKRSPPGSGARTQTGAPGAPHSRRWGAGGRRNT